MWNTFGTVRAVWNGELNIGVKLADRAGISAALAAIGAGDVPALEEAEQLELVPELPGPLPLASEGRAAKAAGAGERRGPGRPAGSRNRRSEEMIRFLTDVKGYQPPLQVLAETWSRPVRDLAQQLEVDLADAFKLQQAAAMAALPYWHERKPQAIDVTGADAGLLAVFMGSPDAAAGVALMPLGPDMRGQGNQGVIDGEIVQSDDVQSDDDEKASDDKGLNDVAD